LIKFKIHPGADASVINDLTNTLKRGIYRDINKIYLCPHSDITQVEVSYSQVMRAFGRACEATGLTRDILDGRLCKQQIISFSDD